MVYWIQFSGETVNTFLTGVECNWRRGAIYFCIKQKSLYIGMQISYFYGEVIIRATSLNQGLGAFTKMVGSLKGP